MNDKKRRKRKKRRINSANKPKTTKAKSQNTESKAESFQPSTVIHELREEKAEAPKKSNKSKKHSRRKKHTGRKPKNHQEKAGNPENENNSFQPAVILHELPEEKTETPKETEKPKPHSHAKRSKAKRKHHKKRKPNKSSRSASSLPAAERALISSTENREDDSVEDSSVEAFYASQVITESAVQDAVSTVTARTGNLNDGYSAEHQTAESTAVEQSDANAGLSTESREEHRARQKRYQKKRNKRRQIEENFGRKEAKDTPETVGVVEYIREKILSNPEREKPNRKAKTVISIILVIALIAVFIMAMVSAASMLMEVLTSYLAISTYPSDDSDMLAAERQYCKLEERLQKELDDYENTHDYDEYKFELDDMGHDPYVLISCITAKVGGEWSIGEVRDIIQDLFDRQYELKEEVETVEDKTVCTVTLTNNDLASIPGEILDEEQLSRYAIYMAVLGNRPDLFPDSEYIGKYINGEYEVYEIPPEALEDEKFAAMIEEAEKYLGYPYVWGGSSPSTSFDCSGYICWILNHSGWSVGRTTAQGLFNSCTPVSRANARPGDLVFFTGTYKTEDKCSHVGLYVGDNMMIHCGDPITYTSIASDYWQSHFYAFARLP